jgi:hypothetical protein
MIFARLATVVGAVAGVTTVVAQSAFVNQTTCNGKQYTYQELVDYGAISGDASDEFGDAIGGIGSSLVIDRSIPVGEAVKWKQYWSSLGTAGSRLVSLTTSGVNWSDERNTEGTLNFQPRIYKLDILFTPEPSATVANPSGNNLFFTYKETVRFFGLDGTPCTGLGADPMGHISFPSFPDLSVATYAGDSFGNVGPGGRRVPVDAEGLALNPDGSFWVSDEYGPYIYSYVLLFLI